MADYHIYLHSDQKQSISSNTKPKEESMGGVFSASQVIGGVKSFATSGFSGVISTGVSSLAKAVPFVAVAVAAVKITDKVLTTGFNHLESYTGNYQYAMDFNNFKTAIGLAINPIGTLLKQEHINAETKKFNDKQNEIRSLMGQRYIGV